MNIEMQGGKYTYQISRC